MKHIILLSIIGLLAQATYGQATTTPVTNSKLDSLAKLSQRFVNDNQPDSLYALMGDTSKKKVSLDKLKEAMGQITGQAGKWTGLEPQGITNGVARYKAVFALTSLAFYISHDKQGKIETFLFKPL